MTGGRAEFGRGREAPVSAGDVIVEVAQEAVNSARDVQKRIDALKKDGKKSLCCWSPTPMANCASSR